MAAVPITISGVLYDKTARTQQAVLIAGTASITGLTIGGGPIITPPDGVVEPPLEIWPPGPGIELPTHPIVIPPDLPPMQPPSDTSSPPKPGWNWYSGPEGSGWYWAYIPGQTAPSPKAPKA